MVGSCSISVLNNSVSNEDLIASTFLEESELSGTTRRLPLRAQRDTAARVLSTNVHNARRGGKLARAAGSVSSAMTLTAELRI